MKVKDFILTRELPNYEKRLIKLLNMDAPSMLCKATMREIKRLKQGEVEINGEVDLLDAEFESFEIKTGRGGKKYVLFDNGVSYFPQAKYGRYVAKL